MTFTLHLTPEKYQKYYQGAARAVRVTTDDGRTLRFPANALQPFIMHDGIYGRFEILFDSNNKMVGLNKIG